MKSITLYLGSKCNLNCAYCHRESSENESGISDAFIKRLRKDPPTRIKFMGGEPTLYMDDIKKVVEACPAAKFSITTNGVLLQRYIDYLKAHNFRIIISYDGADADMDKRDFNSMNSVRELANIGVSTTAYHGNTDLRKIMKNFRLNDSTRGKNLSCYPHLMHKTSSEDNDMHLTREDVLSLVEQHKDAVKTFTDGAKFGYSNICCRNIVSNLVRRIGYNFEFGETYCVNKNLKKYDGSGNMYTCLYKRTQLLDEDDWQKQQAEIIRKRFPKCEGCDVYEHCGAACIVSEAHDIECLYYHELLTWFKDYFKKHKETILRGLVLNEKL